MTRQDAMRVLLACRPGTGDEREPEVAEALALVERDAALRTWFEQHRFFQDKVRAQLRATPVPPGLRDRILAERKIVRPLWRRPEFLLAAACLAAALVVLGTLFPRSTEDMTLAGFQSRMVGFALRQYRMDIVTNDLQQVRTFQQRQGAPADYRLTPALQSTPVMGGASLPWQGNPVSMVCFTLAPGKIAYMFVVEAASLPASNLPGARPVVSPAHGVMTATWRQDGKVYLLAADTDLATLEHLVRPQG